jgi:hypothetical protein
LVKGNVSLKEGEEAKGSPYGSNRQRRLSVILLMAQKCVTAPGEVRRQYRTRKFASAFTGEAMAVLKSLEIISESQGESDPRSVRMRLNEKSLTKSIQY